MMVVILTPVDGIIRWLPRGFSCSPDSNAVGGQDYLDLSLLGITAGSFNGNVAITGNNGNTVVTVGADVSNVVGVNSITVNIGDFILELPSTFAANNGNNSLIA